MSTDQSSCFDYPPIDLSKQQIRLIKYTSYGLPKFAPDLLIDVFDFEECPDYTALSYNWGSMSPSFQIDIYHFGTNSEPKETENGKDDKLYLNKTEQQKMGLSTGRLRRQPKFSKQTHNRLQPTLSAEDAIRIINLQVRKNLTDFLELLRRDYVEKYFWIDQICIDQRNEKEKNHQVQFMGDIYQKASCVIAWLGTAEQDAYVLKCLESSRWSICCYFGSQKCYPTHFDIKEFLKSLSSFLKRSYWSRVWIIQEVVLAERVEFRCGPFRMQWSDLAVLEDDWTALLNTAPWEALEPLKLWLDGFFSPVKELRDRMPRTQPLYEVLALFHRNDRRSLAKWTWQCERLSDEIYGVMGLVHPGKRLEVNYSSSESQVRFYAWNRCVSQLIDEMCADEELNLNLVLRRCEVIYGKAEKLMNGLRIQEPVMLYIVKMLRTRLAKTRWADNYKRHFQERRFDRSAANLGEILFGERLVEGVY